MADETNLTETDEEVTGKELEGKDSFNADEVKNLLSALQKERTARKAQDKALKESAAKLATLERINPEEFERLQQEAARRAEFEAELQAKEAHRAKQLEQVQADAAKRESDLQRRIQEMQERQAFERIFTSKAVGGKAGKFLDMAFSALRGNLRLEESGAFTVVDENGDPMLDKETGKRIDAAAFLSSQKGDEFLGFAFEPEQGYGGGMTPGPHRRDSGNPANDLKGLSTDQIFARTFGRR